MGFASLYPSCIRRIRGRRKWQFMLPHVPVRFAVAVLSATFALHAVVGAAALAVRRCDSHRVDDFVEHRQIRDLCGERIRQRVARQEHHRRSHVQGPCAREPLSEGNARARIRRTHSFHHLQADRPRTTLSQRSRRALRDDGRQFLLRLADGVWRHLPDVPRSRARQGVAEAVGFQGGEGECRRSDGVDVAQG